MAKLHLSKRTQAVISSPIRKFLPLVLKAEARGIEVLKLNVGDPDIPPAPAFWRALKRYRSATLNYAPSPGIKEHTRAWLKYYSTFGLKLKPEQIIPTVGGAEAILFALLVTTDPGDEVVVFEPLYSSYKGFAAMCNIKLVPVTLKLENGFVLPSKQDVAKKITSRTRAIVVVNPNNPTGTTLSAEELNDIVNLSLRHGLFIIADETYREIVFRGRPTSFLQIKRARQNTILVDSASKRFSLPGARIGSFVSYNPAVMEAALKLAMIRLSAPTLEQHALIPLLANPKLYTSKITHEYRRRRNVVVAALRRLPGVTCYEPQGAFYLIAKLPVINAEQFVKFMLTKFNRQKQTVLVTPAEDFYITRGLGQNEIRIAYVLNTKKLTRALILLRQGLREFLKPKTR
ncbi:MAG: pyridoxal phosphate-dependent aminotransferase [Patescibacteria group bacterium]